MRRHGLTILLALYMILSTAGCAGVPKEYSESARAISVQQHRLNTWVQDVAEKDCVNESDPELAEWAKNVSKDLEESTDALADKLENQ